MRLNDSNKFRAQGSRHLLYVLHKTHHAVGARARPRDNPSGEAHYKPRWPTAEEHLLADDLAELVHIFKENVVVRHGPSPAGEKRSPPEIYVPKRIMFLSGRPRASEYLCRTPLAWTAAGGRVAERWSLLSSCLLRRPHDPSAPSPKTPRAGAAALLAAGWGTNADLTNPAREPTGLVPPFLKRRCPVYVLKYAAQEN